VEAKAKCEVARFRHSYLSPAGVSLMRSGFMA